MTKNTQAIDLKISMQDGTYQLAEEARIAEEAAEAEQLEKIKKARSKGKIKHSKKPR